MRPSDDSDDDKIVQSREINKQLTNAYMCERTIAKVKKTSGNTCMHGPYICKVQFHVLHLQLNISTHAHTHTRIKNCRNVEIKSSRSQEQTVKWASSNTYVLTHAYAYIHTSVSPLLTVAHFKLPSSKFEMSPNQCSIYTRTHVHTFAFELGTHTNAHASMS